jgi:hypothetical protein
MLLRTALVLAALLASSCNCATDPLSATDPVLASPSLLDFGPVAEGTTAERTITVENHGDGALTVHATLVAGSSTDFALEDAAVTVEPHDQGALRVRFTPVGAGEDNGDVALASDDPRHKSTNIALHGGPIEPNLDAPASVDFAGVTSQNVTLANRGLASLHVSAVSVDSAANTAFAMHGAPALPLTVAPSESVTLAVDYTRTADASQGRLLVSSDDPAGVAVVDLLPDPLTAAGEGEGEGSVDTCDADATWSITSGGPVSYSCCIFVNQNITGFVISGNGGLASPVPSSSQNYPLDGAGACPQTLSYADVRNGGCTESYSLAGNFTDANTFTGTYTMSFSGGDCDCFGGTLGSACSDQSFPITATRQ